MMDVLTLWMLFAVRSSCYSILCSFKSPEFRWLRHSALFSFAFGERLLKLQKQEGPEFNYDKLMVLSLSEKSHSNLTFL